MKFTLINENDVPLLSRKRLKFEVDYSGSKTPSNDEVKKSIATLQKVKEDLIEIRHIYPRFGESKAKVIVHIYKTAADLKKYGVKVKKPKEAKAEDKPAEASVEKKPEEKKPKEEKPAEAKPEEKKEEKPKEVKEEKKEDGKEESKEQESK